LEYATTQLEQGLLARRSVYCSKFADGPHSMVTTFANPHGNIFFERTERKWVAGHGWVIRRGHDG
jgi:site-specific DNA-methyltransferase (adenine-specific)